MRKTFEFSRRRDNEIPDAVSVWYYNNCPTPNNWQFKGICAEKLWGSTLNLHGGRKFPAIQYRNWALAGSGEKKSPFFLTFFFSLFFGENLRLSFWRWIFFVGVCFVFHGWRQRSYPLCWCSKMYLLSTQLNFWHGEEKKKMREKMGIKYANGFT